MSEPNSYNSIALRLGFRCVKPSTVADAIEFLPGMRSGYWPKAAARRQPRPLKKGIRGLWSNGTEAIRYLDWVIGEGLRDGKSR